MYRYEFQSRTPSRAASREGAHISVRVCDVMIKVEEGAFTLLRLKIFKGEALVPVIPTQYALFCFPVTLDDGGVPTGAIGKFFDEMVAQLGPEPPPPSIVVERVLHDPARAVVYVLLCAIDGNTLLDALDFVDRFSGPALQDGRMQRVVAFPCDARPAEELGDASIASEYFALPPCLLCMDRLERNISGLHGSVCSCPSHSHCACHIASSCTVCQLLMCGSSPATGCEVCQLTEAWVCLVCGFIGCSRYHSQHAKEHFKITGHEFCLSLTTQQVWDYNADNFVHRILVRASSSSGATERLELPPDGDVSYPSSVNRSLVAKGVAVGPMDAEKLAVDAKMDYKVEQCCMEYTRLLTSQLESQRLHFETLLQQQHQQPPHQPGCGHPSPLEGKKQAGELELPVDEAAASAFTETVFASLDSEVRTWEQCHQQWLLTERKAREVEARRKRAEQEHELALQKNDELRGSFRNLLQRQQGELKALNEAIEDVQAALRETKLNLKAATALKARGVSRDEMQSSVTMLEGKKIARKKR